MLTSLLPGFRHVRTPFAVGALCAFQAWMLFGGWIPCKGEAQGLTKRMYVIGELLGRPIVTATIAFALYLLGDMLKLSARQVAGRINKAKPSMRTALLTRDSYRELHLYAESLRARAGDSFDLMTAMTALIREFPEVRMRLIANNLDVYSEQDRFDSEADFRVNLAAYSVTLWIILATLWSPWFLFGISASAILYLNGFRALRAANGVIMQSLVSGIVESHVYAEGGHHPHSHP
ncbi:hypothetical protein OHT17_32230 [Streptomyces sp. NBC_00371]|uniref:hypothetical protein n=1 Tax=Streptomyces sp. NBC_00371 TaxID=2975729 RepID=UPI002E2550A3